MSKENGVVITSAVRTAIGDLGGSLKNVSAHKLGSTAISSAIEKSNIKASDINFLTSLRRLDSSFVSEINGKLNFDIYKSYLVNYSLVS